MTAQCVGDAGALMRAAAVLCGRRATSLVLCARADRWMVALAVGLISKVCQFFYTIYSNFGQVYLVHLLSNPLKLVGS